MPEIVMAKDMDRVPIFLYHGTDCKNIPSICEGGIRPGSYDTCNPYTKRTSVGSSFEEDCIGNVSLAVDEKDAIFFVVANAMNAEEAVKSQCIIKVRTMFMDYDRLMFRELFGKPLKEAKYWDTIPPIAIEEVKVRSFERNKRGRLKAVESIERCPRSVI